MTTYNFSLNYPLPTLPHADLMATLAEKLKSDPLAAIKNVPEDKLTSIRETAAQWLKVDKDQIAFGIGGHHIFTSIVQGFTDRFHAMACEEITYNGWLEACKALGRKVVSIKMDKDGMLPDSLDEAAKKEKIWGVFLMPSQHNPLCTTMPLERRKAIVEVCRRYDLWVIDDDAYRFLNPSPPPSFAHLYPERSFWIQSFTKSLFPSIKTAVVAAPVAVIPQLRGALRYQPPGLTLPWITDLMSSGKIDEFILGKQEDARNRQAIAKEILTGFAYQTVPTSFHLWINTPKGWNSKEVTVMEAGRYFAGSGAPPLAMRLTLAGESDLGRMKKGLEIIASELRPQ